MLRQHRGQRHVDSATLLVRRQDFSLQIFDGAVARAEPDAPPVKPDAASAKTSRRVKWIPLEKLICSPLKVPTAGLASIVDQLCASAPAVSRMQVAFV